jgi:hypothetical protein
MANTSKKSVSFTGTIAGDNIINSAEEKSGFAISGTSSGYTSGSTVTVKIYSSSNTLVKTYTTTVDSSGNWTVKLPNFNVADGSYSVQATIGTGSDVTTSTTSITVDGTPPAAPAITSIGDGGDAANGGDHKVSSQ